MGSGSSTAQVHDEAAPLIARRQVSADTFELALHAPRIAVAARPGQFVNVMLPSPDFGYRVVDGEDWQDGRPGDRPFLIRRPFSIYRTYRTDRTDRSDVSDLPDAPADTLALLVKVVGEGTKFLAELPLGTTLQVLGPLGNEFRLPPAGAAAALVAGGCGWASLAMLARELRRLDHPTYAFIGAKTADGLPNETTEPRPRSHSILEGLPEVCVTSNELEALGVVVGLAAEEGGRLYGGFVTDLLAMFLQGPHGRGAHVYACGPWAMLARVAGLAREHKAPCQVSMEERMACGMGVCNSCVVEVILPEGQTGHKKLCVEGPVLDAAEVNWDQKGACNLLRARHPHLEPPQEAEE